MVTKTKEYQVLECQGDRYIDIWGFSAFSPTVLCGKY